MPSRRVPCSPSAQRLPGGRGALSHPYRGAAATDSTAPAPSPSTRSDLGASPRRERVIRSQARHAGWWLGGTPPGHSHKRIRSARTVASRFAHRSARTTTPNVQVTGPIWVADRHVRGALGPIDPANIPPQVTLCVSALSGGDARCCASVRVIPIPTSLHGCSRAASPPGRGGDTAPRSLVIPSCAQSLLVGASSTRQQSASGVNPAP